MSTWGMWDWKVGESAFRTAIELNPNHALAHAYYSHLLNITKRPLEAIKEIELAIKLDPYNPLLKSLYAADLLIVRRYNEAIEAADDSLKMDSNGPVALTMYEMALYHKGKYKEALEPIKKIWGVLYGFSDFGDKL
jgi:adenylate cyclase